MKKYPFAKSWRWIWVALFDLLTYPFRLFSKKPFPSNIQNILVLRLDQIGDVIIATSALTLIKKRFPKAKITVVTDEFGTALLTHNPCVDQLVYFPQNWFSRSKEFSWTSFFKTVSELKKYRFDLGYDLRGDVRNILFMSFVGVPYKISYGIAGGQNLLQQEENYDQHLHQAELNARLIEGKNVPLSELKTQIILSVEEKSWAEKKLFEHDVQKNDSIILIHPEAGYLSKEWPLNYFHALILKVLKETNAKIVLVGISTAQNLADSFKENSRVVNLVGQLNLRELIAIIHETDLFIGNDSGPSHMAQAVGVPCVILASGTNEYELWGLWQQPLKILKYSVPCSPCHLKECNVPGHPCMTQIQPEHVFAAVKELLTPHRHREEAEGRRGDLNYGL